MITGTLRSQVDQVWNAFWSGGISNPLTVIEQISYLLFAKRLDELHTLRERKANRTGKLIEDPIFAPTREHLRWSRFKDREAGEFYELFRDDVFPFIKNLHQGRESAYSRFMKDAVFVIPTPGLLKRVVTMLDQIDMNDRDTKGDLYEYMLSKIASAGQNGQFRTPRHIIRLMVEMLAPTPRDTIADPACSTCGFLVAASEYLREHHPALFHDAELRWHFNEGMFHGTDFDSSMLRIGAMNMTLHGVENPDIRGVDALSKDGAGIRERYTVILANPPFKGPLDYESVAKDLLQVTTTKKTELLFLALFLKQLKPGGRCACIVPDGCCSVPARRTASFARRWSSSTSSTASCPASRRIGWWREDKKGRPGGGPFAGRGRSGIDIGRFLAVVTFQFGLGIAGRRRIVGDRRCRR